MAYEKQEWIDHIEEDGTVKQQGTAMDALHFNHIEDGIYVANEHADNTDNPHNTTAKQLGFGVIFFYDEEGYLCVKNSSESS